MARKPPIDAGDAAQFAREFGMWFKRHMTKTVEADRAAARLRYLKMKRETAPAAETAKSLGTMGGKTVKGPKGKPRRTPTASLKGKTIAKTVSQQHEAERQANRLLRMNAEAGPRKPAGKPKIDPNFPRVPKRSKSGPKPSRGATEADALRRQMLEDINRIGRGQRKPKPKKPKGPPPPTGGAKVKPKPRPKKPSGGAALVK